VDLSAGRYPPIGDKNMILKKGCLNFCCEYQNGWGKKQ